MCSWASRADLKLPLFNTKTPSSLGMSDDVTKQQDIAIIRPIDGENIFPTLSQTCLANGRQQNAL